MKRGRRPHPDILTPREWEVLELIRDGLSNEEIASRLGISIDGAKYHVSEILTKLGVPDRLAAARWRPGREGAWLPIPIPTIRLGWSHVIGGAAFAVVVASTVGVFVWLLGAVDSGGGETRVVGIATTATPAGPQGSVLLFDAVTGRARRISVDHGLNYAQWLASGETFVAYDWPDNAWKVFDVQGNEVRTVVRSDPTGDGRLLNHVEPSPDGRSILVQSVDDLNFRLYDATTGTTRSFELPGAVNNGPVFSPDGGKIAFANQRPDGVSLYVMDADGTDQTAIRSLDGEGQSIGVQSWSPDGRAVLAYVDRAREVIDMEGIVLWSATFDRLTDVKWTVLNQLLVLQPEIGAEGGGTVPAKAWLVDVVTGGMTPAPTDWANGSFCCNSISPDGEHAIVREDIPLAEEYQNDYNGIAPGGARCALINTADRSYVDSVVSGAQDANTGFCSAVDWSPDGEFALVSMGGN